MKINEILVEAGFWSGALKGVGFTPSAGKSSFKYKDDVSWAPKPDVQNKAVADLTQLASQQQNSVNLQQIAAILARYTTDTDKDKLMGQVKYIGNLLITKGISVPEIKAAQDVMTRAEKGVRLVNPDDTFEWDARGKILTIIGPHNSGEMSYKKLKTDAGMPTRWLDIHSDQEVTDAGNRELETAFNRASGAAPVSNTNTPATIGNIVIPPDQELRVELTAHPGVFYYKFPNGTWKVKYSSGTEDPVAVSSSDAAILNAMDPSTLKSQTFATNPNP